LQRERGWGRLRESFIKYLEKIKKNNKLFFSRYSIIKDWLLMSVQSRFDFVITKLHYYKNINQNQACVTA
jgi:hypothetical protein